MEQADLDPGGAPPEDDRNEQIDDSPAPDPEQGTSAEDVPQAD